LKPETVLYYNENKCGIDVFDQLCSNYSCARRTLKWPLHLFFGVLDQAGVNSCILWNLIADHEILSRREFLKSLVLALVKPHLQDRMQIPNLLRNTKLNIREILGENENQPSLQANKMEKRQRCFICDKKQDKKSFSAASSVAGLCAMNTDVKYALIAYNNFASTLP